MIYQVLLLEFIKIHAHSESESGIESYKPNATPDCDTDPDSDVDCALPTALSGSPNQAFGSAGGSMTSPHFSHGFVARRCRGLWIQGARLRDPQAYFNSMS
ncbi:MAG: hypothetical protein P8Z37_13970, partial [Acidobacteriota bacterium]